MEAKKREMSQEGSEQLLIALEIVYIWDQDGATGFKNIKILVATRVISE